MITTKKSPRSTNQVYIDTFLHGIGHPLPDKPTLAENSKLLLYARLLIEEAWEYLEAAGISVKPRPEYVPNTSLTFRDLMFESVDEPNLEHIADAFGDVVVIATGGMSINGISDLGLMREINNNNLLKLANGHKDPITGKFIKPKDHPPPDIARVLDEQGRLGGDVCQQEPIASNTQ